MCRHGFNAVDKAKRNLCLDVETGGGLPTTPNPKHTTRRQVKNCQPCFLTATRYLMLLTDVCQPWLPLAADASSSSSNTQLHALLFCLQPYNLSDSTSSPSCHAAGPAFQPSLHHSVVVLLSSSRLMTICYKPCRIITSRHAITSCLTASERVQHTTIHGKDLSVDIGVFGEEELPLVSILSQYYHRRRHLP